MRKTILSILFCVFAAVSISAQTTEFTYQGNLKNVGTPANGNFDFEFKLYDFVGGGAQQGNTVQKLNVAVADGVFTVSLDFGAGNLPGADRYLDIAVRSVGGGAFTALSPRQKVTSAPYSVKSLNSTNATTATNATQLGGVAANQYVVTTDPRMTDARQPTAGSTNYIQNQNASPQASSNFNISGTGTAGVFNASIQFNLNGNRILSNPGTENLFAGVGAGQANTGSYNSFFGLGAGQANTTGNGNSFFGRAAGLANTTGGDNSFFGENAGLSNTVGTSNSFFGIAAGQSNTTGTANAFFGGPAGLGNTTGSFNSFFGFGAGRNNTTGDTNSFFGQGAGLSNTTGSQNSFVGWTAGQDNTDASYNSFFGYAAGQRNTSGTLNAFFGHAAGLFNTTGITNSFFGQGAGLNNTTASQNSFFGHAAGYLNTTGANNSFFGQTTGYNNTTGGNNSFFGQGAGQSNTTGGTNSFFGQGAGFANMTGANNSFFGWNAGAVTTGGQNSFIGGGSGSTNTSGTGNSFFGFGSGLNNTMGSNNTIIGYGADVNSGSLQFATAIGAGASVATNNTIALGRSNGSDQVLIPGNLVVSGTYNLPAGDADYIQNTTSPQSSSNFFISGSGFAAGTLGANVVNAGTQYNIAGNRILGNPGANNLFAGANAGSANSSGQQNSFFGTNAGIANNTGNFNSFFGQGAGSSTTSGAGNSFFGRNAGLSSTGFENTFIGFSAGDTNTVGDSNTVIGDLADVGSNNLSYATAIGAFARVDASNSMVLGAVNGVNGATFNTKVGIGTSTPITNLDVREGGANGGRIQIGNTNTSVADRVITFGDAGCSNSPACVYIGERTVDDRMELRAANFNFLNGTIQINSLSSAGSTALCLNASSLISTCSSSLRYKTNINRFSQGMSFVNKLRPISFDWKDDGMRDVGFGAEDIAKIDPRFVTYDKQGQVEGVKYDRLSVAFVNAFKEQQQQIETQKAEIESLRIIVCELKPSAAMCTKKEK